MDKLDKETSAITQEALAIRELVEHASWKIARNKLTDRILELQNAFSIDDKSPEEMLIDLKARKVASTILFDWLKDVEGTATQIETNLPNVKQSHIIRFEE